MLRNELTFLLAAEAARIGFWERDLATGVVTHCPVTACILGLDAKRTTSTAKELEQVIAPEDLPLFKETLHAAIMNGESFDFEFRISLPSGERRWMAVRGMGVRNTAAAVTKAIGVMFDITERKLAEQAMHDTRIRYRLATEAARIGTWEQDIAGDITYISPVTAHMLGLPADKTFLRRGEWQALVLPEDLSKTKGVSEKALRTGQSFNLELRCRRPDGKVIWIAVRGLLQPDKEGQPARSLGIVQDISEAKQAEDILRANEGRFRVLTEFSPDAILVDLDCSFVYANSCAMELFGVSSAQDLLGRDIFDFIDPEYQEVMRVRRPSIIDEKQKPTLFELRMRRVNGSPIDVQAICGKVVWEGRPAIQVMLRDITELKHVQEKLRISNERLKLMIEGAGEGIWEWDASKRVFNFSGGIKQLLVAQQNELYVTEEEWLNATHPEDVERVISTFQDSLSGRIPACECEYRLRTRQGGWNWVKARGIIVERDTQGAALMMIGTLSDITARKEADELSWKQANLDVLTNLPNRRLFRERLEVELMRAKRTQRQLALLFIDLDGFKQVNDLYGHDAGDLLLIEAAQRLKRCIRGTDIVSRLGGDEFTVILTDLVQMDHVEFICQKILSNLTEPFALGEDVGHVSASIGVAMYPLDGHASEELTRKADQAMYSAKQTGKNQFNYFTREMDDKAHLRLKLTNDLHSALLLNQFEVHYQPVVDLDSGRITKAEALLRWRHPTLGKVEPSLFIPLAEESGLIRSIGSWVFREAA